ncbi:MULTISPECIES: S8 family peptidase [Halobacteriales]|uniref:Subtilase family protein n=2 Tax=Halobacteriales TaxID=2235 RepID=A0A1I0QYX8_9EURY|nr:S8 family serine peptidase [Natrinema salifodinae]SEW32852.1 Subtilase family protein [Natrinema salifodinae]
MTRKVTTVALTLAVLLAGITVPVAAADSPVAFQEYDRGGDLQPSFIVHYEDGTLDSLETWTEEDARYDLIAVNNDSSEAVVTGPQYHVSTPGLLEAPRIAALGGTSLAVTPLESRSYIEDVSPNYRHSYVEPITSLATADEYDTPASNWRVRGSWATDGIAFTDDANESTIGDARQVIDADAVSADGSGVDVAVLDTGLNVKNASADPLYGDRIAGAYNFVTDESGTVTNGFENISDGNGHGSWVASAIAANATNDSYDGVAPGATLHVGKTLADDGSGSTADIVDGIRWAETQDTDILSMSLGSPVYDEEIATALEDYLEGNGTVAYVAVGNSRMVRPAQIASPADVPEDGIISVAATTAEEPANASVAYFSQTGKDNGVTDLSSGTTRGASPDVAAPGMQVTVPTYSESGYRTNSTLSGTSMATPIEAARGAVGLSANPSLENQTETFAEWVRNTTNPVPNAGITEVGNGMGSVARLANLNASEETQKEARTDAATGRDAANGNFGTGFQFQAIRQVQQAVGL